MKSKTAEEIRRKREEIVVIDKSVGSSCEMLNDAITEKDAANNTMHIDIEDKVINFIQ